MSKSRAEQEQMLESKYLNQIVTHQPLKGQSVTGKIDQLSFWPQKGFELVSFQINTRLYKCDLDYFEENTTIL